jgi:hypothetical protein
MTPPPPRSLRTSVRRFFGHFIDCKQATRLISKKQERPLGLADRILLKLHLGWCVACVRFAGQMRFLRRAMNKYRD